MGLRSESKIKQTIDLKRGDVVNGSVNPPHVSFSPVTRETIRLFQPYPTHGGVQILYDHEPYSSRMYTWTPRQPCLHLVR